MPTAAAEATFKRARVTRLPLSGEPIIHRRVRFVYLEGRARVIESDGSVTREIVVAEATQHDARNLTLTADTGEVWEVYRAGCNCGG